MYLCMHESSIPIMQSRLTSANQHGRQCLRATVECDAKGGKAAARSSIERRAASAWAGLRRRAPVLPPAAARRSAAARPAPPSPWPSPAIPLAAAARWTRRVWTARGFAGRQAYSNAMVRVRQALMVGMGSAVGAMTARAESPTAGRNGTCPVSDVAAVGTSRGRDGLERHTKGWQQCNGVRLSKRRHQRWRDHAEREISSVHAACGSA